MTKTALAMLAMIALGTSACGETAGTTEGPLDQDPDALLEVAAPRLAYEPQPGDDPTNIVLVSFELGATVGEANAVLGNAVELVGSFPGREGEARSLLVLRTNTEDAEEMDELVASLSAEPSVALAVHDAILVGNRLTEPPHDEQSPATWKWNKTPRLATWAHTLTRIPEMWNLAGAVRRGDAVDVAIVDLGFAPQHPDLDVTWDGAVHDHGAMVAGLIGAKWNNAFGIDGISPNVDMSLYTKATFAATVTGPYPDAIRDGAKVINTSIGVVWGDDDPSTDPEAAAVANKRGEAFRIMLAAHADETTGALPLMVVSAGNDSTDSTTAEARYNSPEANAALEHGVANIIVVESFEQVGGQPWQAKKKTNSNLGGHLSGPGHGMLSTGTVEGLFVPATDTSAAAPFIAGLAAFMYGVEPELPMPTLASNEMLEIMTANAVPIAGGAPRFDAFATVMDIDRVTGGREVLLALCDIDDGTLDGNTRVDLATGQLNTEEAEDEHGVRGDGFVDMKDFRRFRDWLLVARDKADGLDGGNDHPKNDLNLNGLVEDWALEFNPRADFNGDRVLDEEGTALVRGHLNRKATDLEVFMAAFEDPDYDASELPGLLESGDVLVDLDACFANTDVAEVSVDWRQDGTLFDEKLVLGSEAHHELRTLALGEYGVAITARDASGEVLTEADTTLTLEAAGQDLYFSPNCGASVGGWLVERLDIAGAKQLNDQGQVLGSVGLSWAVLQPDGAVDDLGEDGAWRLSPSGPIRQGMLTEGLMNDNFSCPLLYMDVQAISPSGVQAGGCWQQGTPEMAWIKLDPEVDGPAGEVLAPFTHEWREFGSGSPLRPQAVNNHAINDAGLWVGAAEPDFGEPMVPAILSGEQPEWLALPAGYTRGSAELVNAGGTIAGMVNDGDGARALVLWDGTSPRVIETEPLDNWWGPLLLSDDGTLIGACTDSTECFYILTAGNDTLEPFPTTLEVEELDGTMSTHEVVSVVDTNGMGQLLVAGRDPMGAGSTLLVTLQ